MWTVALIYATNGAPVEEFGLLDRFLKDFEKCRLLNYVVLPEFKSDNGPVDSNTSDGNYDLSVPLEICTTVSREDKTAVPMCNETFEIIRNLSTCRDDKQSLKKAIALFFKPINIEVQVDTVCEDFVASRSILARKEKSVAFKLADNDICPMVCQGKVSKACAFLLWGHKVQALISDGLHSSVLPNQGASVVPNIHQDEKHNIVRDAATSAEGSPKNPEPEEHEVSRSSVTTETLENYQSSGLDKSSVSTLKKTEPQAQSVEPKLQKSKTEKGEQPKLERLVTPTSNSEESVQKGAQSSDHSLAAKTSVTSTTATEKSSILSSSGVPENHNIQHVLEGHSEKNMTDMNAKPDIAGSSADIESHDSFADGKHPDKVNKANGDTLGSSSLDAEKKIKGKGTSTPGSAVPEGDFIDSSLPDNSKVSAGEQEYSEEETSPADSAKNEIKNEGDPPSAVGSKPNLPVTGTSEKILNPQNSAHEKAAEVTLTKVINSASVEDSTSNVIQDTSDGMDNPDQSEDVNEKSHSGFNKDEIGISNEGQKSETLANLGANKTPARGIENGGFPEQEDTHFFFYFVTIVIFAIGGYVLFHNKQKIFALIIEGRHERRRRSGASYRKLETK